MTDRPIPDLTPQTPWALEVYQGRISTSIITRFMFKTEAGAMDAYARLNEVKRKREARENDYPRSIEIQDAYGAGTIDSEDVTGARVYQAAAWGAEIGRLNNAYIVNGGTPAS